MQLLSTVSPDIFSHILFSWMLGIQDIFALARASKRYAETIPPAYLKWKTFEMKRYYTAWVQQVNVDCDPERMRDLLGPKVHNTIRTRRRYFRAQGDFINIDPINIYVYTTLKYESGIEEIVFENTINLSAIHNLVVWDFDSETKSGREITTPFEKIQFLAKHFNIIYNGGPISMFVTSAYDPGMHFPRHYFTFSGTQNARWMINVFNLKYAMYQFRAPPQLFLNTSMQM